ncbi:hypothetical protein ONZ45_g14950 [Pleurotus djamor]|nr:hypothetical protein ONZ45_g14950 [Pleurotus djamor]
MSKLQDLSTLVEGMKSAETTQNWDVIVSYSVDRLNNLLKTIWSAKDALEVIRPVTRHTDPREEEDYEMEWEVMLAFRTLSFKEDGDGHARLEMALVGRHRVKGKNRKGLPYSWKDIPDKCMFIASIPLQSVRAREGDIKGSNPTPGRIPITFDDHPDTKLHVVFNFDNTSSSSFSIEGPEAFSNTFQDLATALSRWMKDHVNTVQYSLAAVAPTHTQGATYLTPEAMAFTLHRDDKDSCLSVYIKTKDSGNAPGNQTRVFQLPGKHGMEALPIPKGYSASIIIRNKLFRERFLLDSLKDLRDGEGKKSFESVTSNSTTDGFKLDLRLDHHVIGDFTKRKWYGGLSVGQINWRLSQSPLDLQIRDGRADWDYFHEFEVGWHQYGTNIDIGGIVVWKPSIHITRSPIISTSQEQILAEVEIKSTNWHVDKMDYKQGRSLYPMVPKQIRDGLESVCMPTFSRTIRLDFFATTNIFAPGKHIIDIDISKGVMTPYDVLLVGNVVSPTEYADLVTERRLIAESAAAMGAEDYSNPEESK